MISEEKLKSEDDIWPFDNIFTIILQEKKEKWKINFYCCKEIFIRAGYSKLLLSQGNMLFVGNMNFYVPVFQLLPDSSTLL